VCVCVCGCVLSIAFQIRIFRTALEIYGDELRYAAMDAKHPNRWLANVAKYIDAEETGRLDELRVKKLKIEYKCVMKVKEVLNQMNIIENEDDLDDNDLILLPRSQNTLYNSILAGVVMWKRPPHNHCDRCASEQKARLRIMELTAALYGDQGVLITAVIKRPSVRQAVQLLREPSCNS